MARRGVLIALQLGLLLLALLIPQQVYSAPADPTVAMAQQTGTPKAATTSGNSGSSSGSSSTRQFTVSVLVVSLSSLLLRFHF